ncbi:uncharacterized protein RHIMIDRAFT_267984 [Rhizopus microsporus ATCC 52813]|uniref:MULE transposase domain-containing protein n=1 Tax=Rhizopus microsporus ATCC 52813 TaxID=1340429 RepID=A0A2G4SII9_RHIZD|nr:uncharacterized protein RHIMIDRAFT_267984 [Rhizopus microsporus ATCC 52813]PHZ08598.1 hypothetical protein RHIMIDRAFT_267984 [Rhizopus microsporus ATCC 52813]
MYKHGKEYENNHKRVSGDERSLSHALHPHQMATDCRTYAVFPNTVRNLFENTKCNASSILENLKAQGINNLVTRDLHNIRQQHFKPKKSESSEVLNFVNNLKIKDYIVKVRANSDNAVDMVFFFFAESEAIAEARRMPECIVIDAMYKTNSHGLMLLNTVGTSNTTGDVRDTLTTYHIAGVWIKHEKTENYLWVLQMFKDSVFPDALVANTSLELSNVFVLRILKDYSNKYRIIIVMLSIT